MKSNVRVVALAAGSVFTGMSLSKRFYRPYCNACLELACATKDGPGLTAAAPRSTVLAPTRRARTIAVAITATARTDFVNASTPGPDMTAASITLLARTIATAMVGATMARVSATLGGVATIAVTTTLVQRVRTTAMATDGAATVFASAT